MKKILITSLILLSGCAGLKKQVKTLEQELLVEQTKTATLQKSNDSLSNDKHYLCAWILELQSPAHYIGSNDFFLYFKGEIFHYSSMEKDCHEALEKYTKEVPGRREAVENFLKSSK